MPIFKYSGVTDKGKKVSGTIDAENEKAARAKLRRSGIFPTTMGGEGKGGSGFSLLNDAIQSGADIFLTSDIKYHDFFEADQNIILADIGHYESEQFTIQHLVDRLKKKFPTFAAHSTGVLTNPVQYTIVHGNKE